MSENPFLELKTELSDIKSLLREIKEKTEAKPEKQYTVKEFADLTDSSPQTIRTWIKEGKINAKRIGRKLFIDHSQFVEGLKEVKSLKYKR